MDMPGGVAILQRRNFGMEYSLEHQEILEQIPAGSQVIILPEDEPEVYAANLRLGQQRSRSENVVYVQVEKIIAPRPVEFVNPRVKVATA